MMVARLVGGSNREGGCARGILSMRFKDCSTEHPRLRPIGSRETDRGANRMDWARIRLFRRRRRWGGHALPGLVLFDVEENGDVQVDGESLGGRDVVLLVEQLRLGLVQMNLAQRVAEVHCGRVMGNAMWVGGWLWGMCGGRCFLLCLATLPG